MGREKSIYKEVGISARQAPKRRKKIKTPFPNAGEIARLRGKKWK